jgi:hypothetical protein
MASERKDRKRRQVAWIEHAIDSAKRHGEDSDPDHEVGDLQELARMMWRAMETPARTSVIRDFIAWAAPTCPRCDDNPDQPDESPLRMCADADPSCMHCDVCDWAGDPTVLARPPTLRRGTAKRRDAAKGSSSEAQERADMRIHLVMNQGAPDEVDTTLASLLRNDDGIREDAALVRRLRGMAIGETIEEGGGAAPVWTARRVAKPTKGSGEEVTCDTHVMLRGTRHWIAVREGIVSVHGVIGKYDNRIAAYTWQGSLVDCIEGEGVLSPGEERKIQDAITKAWAAEP